MAYLYLVVLFMLESISNMKILQLFLFLSLIFPLFHGCKSYSYCPSDDCGNFHLYYPFKILNSSTDDGCSYINMACNLNLDQGRPIVDLPHAGEFYVRDIDYYTQLVQLYDPGNCTMKQLMRNWDLSTSPYKATAYENYTFYMCPSPFDYEYYAFPIHCLSNSTNSTVAIKGVMDPITIGEAGCNLIGSWLLPVAYFGQFEFYGVNGDLYLTWNSTICEDCEGTHERSPAGGDQWDKFAARFLPVCFGLSFVFVYCSMQIMKCRRRNHTDPASQPPNEIVAAASESNANGLDEPTINMCTELVLLGEGKIIPGPDSDHACSICLESYEVGDSLRSMAKCEHCFHAHCIELWLTKNSTCPVCRTSIIDVSTL